MPTNFAVVSLGVLPDLDTTEGNFNAENAGALVGTTVGGVGASLVNDFVDLTPVGDVGTFYDTSILTDNGETLIDNIEAGDLVLTVDHGYQPVRWIGHKTVDAKGELAPILFRKGAMGNKCDLLVSPQYRMLISGWRSELVSGEFETLAAAKHLVNDRDILRKSGGKVQYYHMMFDRHELVYSAGIPSESFHPGDMAMKAVDEEAREEIYTLFPDLRSQGDKIYSKVARPTLKHHEAAMMC